MTIDSEVAPVAATEIPATEAPAQEVPEVAAPETDEAAERDDPTKVVKRMERRIDRLTAARYQAEARAEQAAAEAAQLRARFSQEAPQEDRQDPVALAREIAHVERVTEKANGIAADGNKRFEGFAKAVQTVAAEIGSLFDKSGKPTSIGRAILAASDPAALINHIGTNPDLAADIADLDPTEQTWRLAHIAFEMSKPRELKQSSAPKAITPVSAHGRGEKSPAQMTDAEFAEWRRAQIAKR